MCADFNRGAYILIANLKDDLFIKRKRKRFFLDRGWYVYVGSAMNSLCGRVKYHLGDEKSGRWHVDEILKSAKATVELVILIPSNKKMEEDISSELSSMDEMFKVVEGFGSTDVGTRGNLFKVVDRKKFMEEILKILFGVKKRGGSNDSLYD